MSKIRFTFTSGATPQDFEINEAAATAAAARNGLPAPGRELEQTRLTLRRHGSTVGAGRAGMARDIYDDVDSALAVLDLDLHTHAEVRYYVTRNGDGTINGQHHAKVPLAGVSSVAVV